MKIVPFHEGKPSSTAAGIHDQNFLSRSAQLYSTFSTHMLMGLSLQAFWQNELIFRRNFGYSRFETARTTEGGAHPPGLTFAVWVILQVTWSRVSFSLSALGSINVWQYKPTTMAAHTNLFIGASGCSIELLQTIHGRPTSFSSLSPASLNGISRICERKNGVSLRWWPHPLINLMHYDWTLAELFQNFWRLQRALPIHADIFVKKVMSHLPGCDTLYNMGSLHGNQNNTSFFIISSVYL